MVGEFVCDECGIEIPIVDLGQRRALLVEGEAMMPSRHFSVIEEPPNDGDGTPSAHERR